MTNIAITVAGAEISARVDGILTAGMVGVPVCFSFDETWEDLEKTAIFRASGESYCIRDVQEQPVTLPWEVLRKQGCTLYVGVYGIAADGSLAIPTLWAEAGIIQPGADPEATPGCDPTLPIWKQAIDKADAVYAAFQRGELTPRRGIDYWTEDDKKTIIEAVNVAVLGDVESALDELHGYAQSLMGGEA